MLGGRGPDSVLFARHVVGQCVSHQGLVQIGRIQNPVFGSRKPTQCNRPGPQAVRLPELNPVGFLREPLAGLSAVFNADQSLVVRGIQGVVHTAIRIPIEGPGGVDFGFVQDALALGVNGNNRQVGGPLSTRRNG